MTVLALAPVALVVAPPAAAQPRSAHLVFVQRATLSELARLPGASVGVVNPVQGRYRRAQALLDVSQGSRTGLNAYDPREPPRVRVGRDRIAGWGAVVHRADSAPAEIVPGLLGASVPTAYDGPDTGEAIVAADRAGRLRRGTRAPLVVSVRPSLAGLGAPRTGELLVVVRAPPRVSHETPLLPVAVVGLGAGRMLTSSTTRTDGMIAGTDLAPTILRWLGRPVPDEMQGQRVRLDGPIDLAHLRDLEARLRVVPGRRLPALGTLALAWVLLLGVARGARWAWRVGALALMWLLPVLLALAALAPSRQVEVAAAALGSLALGALTDRLVAWPRAPLVPGAVAVGAYALDLAFGSPLITRSLFGPNPLFGARFYGVGNELESTLPVLALAAVAAAMWPRGRSRAAALAFAVVGVALALVLGAGRLGADVGGVITVGAGTAVAVALAAPGRVTGRRVALVVLTPVAALLALTLVDLVTGGDAHFTRTVLRAHDTDALGDVIARRYELALDQLVKPAMLVLTPLCLVAVALGVRHRAALLRGVPGGDVWGAALAGMAAGGIAGALSNDSGPLLLVFAVVLASWIAAYLRAGVTSADELK